MELTEGNGVKLDLGAQNSEHINEILPSVYRAE